MILRFYRMYFTSCLNIVKNKNIHTARWIIVTGSLIVKYPCFNIFRHIFSRNTRESNISISKRYSKTGKTIGSSRGFRRKRCDHEWGVTGKQLSLGHSDMFAWGYVTCQRVRPRITGGKRSGKRWLGKGASVPVMAQQPGWGSLGQRLQKASCNLDSQRS